MNSSHIVLTESSIDEKVAP